MTSKSERSKEEVSILAKLKKVNKAAIEERAKVAENRASIPREEIEKAAKAKLEIEKSVARSKRAKAVLKASKEAKLIYIVLYLNSVSMQIELLEKYNQDFGGIFNNKSAEINRLKIQLSELLRQLKKTSAEEKGIPSLIESQIVSREERPLLRVFGAIAAVKLGVEDRFVDAEVEAAEVLAAKSVSRSKIAKAVTSAKAAVVKTEDLKRTKPEKPSILDSIKNGFSYVGACFMSIVGLAKKIAFILYGVVKGAASLVYSLIKPTVSLAYKLIVGFYCLALFIGFAVQVAAQSVVQKIGNMLGIGRKDANFDPFGPDPKSEKSDALKAARSSSNGFFLGSTSKELVGLGIDLFCL